MTAMTGVAAVKPPPASTQVKVSVVVGGDADADALEGVQVAVDATPGNQATLLSLEKYPGGVVRTTLPPMGTALTVVNPIINEPVVAI